MPLFDRTGRRLRATRDGETFYEEVGSALRRIVGASRRLQSHASARRQDLLLAVHFGFAHRWLLPNLPRLESAFPATLFEVYPVDRDDAPEMAGADLTVRFGRFDQRGANEWPLFHEKVFPVCSPGCAERFGLVDPLDAGDLARVPLLHMDDRDARWLNWYQWCEMLGMEPPARTTRFNYHNYPLLLNAAVQGSGLALGWSGLVEPMIEEGTLVRLGPVVERDDRGYLLGARHPDSALIAAVMDWFRRNVA